MIAALSDLQRRLANVIRVGKVASIDYGNARVKVTFDGVTTPWMPWAAGRAGAVRDWSPPSVGEQVCIMSPMGEIGSGFVMAGGINSTTNAAPDTRAGVHRFDIPSSGSYEIHCGGSTLVLNNGKMTFIGDLEVTGKITATSDIKSTGGDVKAGSISLKTHTHGGVQGGPSNTGTPT